MVTSASEQDRIIKDQIYPLSEGEKKQKPKKADKAFWNFSGGPVATNRCSQCRKSRFYPGQRTRSCVWRLRPGSIK